MVVKRQLQLQSHYSLVRRTLMQSKIFQRLNALMAININAYARGDTH